MHIYDIFSPTDRGVAFLLICSSLKSMVNKILRVWDKALSYTGGNYPFQQEEKKNTQGLFISPFP